MRVITIVAIIMKGWHRILEGVIIYILNKHKIYYYIPMAEYQIKDICEVSHYEVGISLESPTLI